MRLNKIITFLIILILFITGCSEQVANEEKEINESLEANNKPTIESKNIEPENTGKNTEESIDFIDPLDDIYASINDWKSTFYNYTETPESTGKTYYISNSGNDSNDGLTPETAWATLENTITSDLNAGDVVLLERGGEWNNNELLKKSTILWKMVYQLKSGVILGAYGEGDRPVLRGDEIGADNPENWILYDESEEKKIWVYSKELLDCPVVVFNDGNSYAYKVWPLLKGEVYVNEKGETLDIGQALYEDLTFCSLVDTSNDQTLIREGTALGNLYLRCDEGNPAEVFYEIAIPQLPVGIHLLKDAKADGIEIEYFTMNGVGMDSYGGGENTGMTLSNCEISWCGGLIGEYQDYGYPDGLLIAYASGGPVQISGTDVTATNNYIHDSAVMTFIISLHADGPDKITFSNILIEGNLIERSGTALHWADLTTSDNKGAQGFISNLEFSNNIVKDTGSGWVKKICVEDTHMWIFLSSIESYMGASRNDGIYIQDNTFFFAERDLIIFNAWLSNSEKRVENDPIFSGNTYIQKSNKRLALWNAEAVELTQEEAVNKLKDDTSKVIIVDDASSLSTENKNTDLQRAKELGIGESLGDTPITYAQFLNILNNTVHLCNEELAVEWQNKFIEARTSDQVLTRQEGMLLLYLVAEMLGSEYNSFNTNWQLLNDKMGASCWDEITMDYPLINGWEQPAKIYYSDRNNDFYNCSNHMIAAYFYSFGRAHRICNWGILEGEKLLFDYDITSNSMRLKDNLTSDDAILSALRLYESVKK